MTAGAAADRAAPNAGLPADGPDGVDAVVIGAGFTGLAAAEELAAAGRRVVVLDAEDDIGGLARGYDVGGQSLERFYHHWFASDTEIFDLCARLGLADVVTEHESRTGMYYANSIFRLSRPLDLLRYTPLPFRDRVRLGLQALHARRVTDWRALEQKTAEEWMVPICGRRVFDQVWRPLLEGKFGEHASRVGATWMWTKLHLRGGSRASNGREVLYYLRGGCTALLEQWAAHLRRAGVELRTGTPVRGIVVRDGRVAGVRTDRGTLHGPQVLATPAPGLVADLLPADDPTPDVPDLRRRLRRIEYLANICLVLENDRPLSDTYWLNVADPSFPYVGVIEHTNLDSPERYGGRRVVYLSKYLPADADLYRMSDEEVFRYSLPHLRRMFPAFDESWVRRYRVWRADHAQPIITPDYSRIVPPMRSGLPGLFLSSMAQIYPEDRGTNYAVKQGRQAGLLMADEARTRGPGVHGVVARRNR